MRLVWIEAWGVLCRGAIAILRLVFAILGRIDLSSGLYQVVDGLSAKSADQVDEQLEDEHYQDERGHGGRVGAALWLVISFVVWCSYPFSSLEIRLLAGVSHARRDVASRTCAGPANLKVGEGRLLHL